MQPKLDIITVIVSYLSGSLTTVATHKLVLTTCTLDTASIFLPANGDYVALKVPFGLCLLTMSVP